MKNTHCIRVVIAGSCFALTVACAAPERPVPAATSTGEMAGLSPNARLVGDFYRQAFVDGDVAGAAGKYIGDPYLQHNPNVADGKQAFITAVSPIYNANGARSRIGQIIDGGDTIVVHAESTANETRTAVIDIFRVQNGRIVEHWDALQKIPDTTASGRPMVP